MYSHIWNKYISVVRILLKRALTGDQSLQLNSSDFEKTGPQKKAGFNFVLRFKNGRLQDLASLTNPAKELADVLMQDSAIRQQLGAADYELSMNSKYMLGIHVVVKQEESVPSADVENSA